MEIILASLSQRRSEILASCGIRHRVVPSHARESSDNSVPVHETVITNAAAKAESVAVSFKNAAVIGADTLVVHGGTIIGKPKDETEARKFLADFSAAGIEVYTGICVINRSNGKRADGFEKSEIHVARMNEEEMERCFGLLGPYDKAGGFSIEGVGAMIFDDIKGSYFNILGLPMIKLKELFKATGLNILDFVNIA